MPPFTFLESAYQLHFYLCFKTQSLKPLLQQDLVQRTIAEVCERERYHLLESQMRPDHLKLLLSLRPNQAVSRVVKMLKGNVGREYGLSCPGGLSSQSASRLWAKGYFAATSGKVNLDLTRAYVENQAPHHGYKGEWSQRLRFRNEQFKSPAFEIAHCLAILNYHVVLATQDRIPLFDEKIAGKLFPYILKIGERHSFAIDRVTFMPDHVHLLLQAIPGVSIEQCVLALMNNTQQWMLKHYRGALKETNAWDVWRPSFYAGSVGEYSTAQVKRFLGGN
jgi:REP-associated tyrosine transposase